MPTTVIHEIVAKKISDKYPYLDNYDFYFGSIAPDAVNLEGFAEKSLRWNAHLRDSNLETWKKNIIDFYNHEEKSLFLKGYIIHIMTDIIYDQYIYDEVIEKIEKLNVENPHRYMTKEMDTFGNNKNHLYVINCLKNSNQTFEIRNISKELLSKWKEKIINQKLENRTSAYITEEVIDKLFLLTTKELEKYNVI